MTIIRGDYIFYAWRKDEDKRYNETVKMLESQGFKLKDVEHGFLNEYEYYENSEGEVKVITNCSN